MLNETYLAIKSRLAGVMPVELNRQDKINGLLIAQEKLT
jgi:hypothetical protein